MSMTVTSQAVSADIAPVMVKPHISQLSSNGSKPLVVYAEVSQGGVPVILADVRATLVSITGKPYHLDLLDNGAGDMLLSNVFIKDRGSCYLTITSIVSLFYIQS